MKKNVINRILVFGVTPFLLFSCFVAKDYEQPTVVSDEASYRVDTLQGDTTSMAAIEWTSFFTDELLKGYIQRALDSNFNMLAAIEQINIAQAYVKQGQAGFFPTLNANLSAQHQELSQNSSMGKFLNGSTNQFQLGLNLSWEADIWGKIRSTKRAAEASYLESVAAQKAVKTKLVASVSSLYYQLLSIDKQIEITKETIENRKESVATIKALKAAGSVTAAAVKQTEAQYYVAQEILIDLKTQRKISENAFCVLMGETPHPVQRNTLEEQRITSDLKLGVPALLLSNRPDVMVAENSYRRAFEMTNVARSAFYPALTITASGGFQSLQVRDLFSLNSLFANIMGGLAQPIFNQRQIRTQYEVAQAQQKQAFYDFEGTILNASREVADALYNYKATDKKIDLERKQYDAFSKAAEYSEDLLNNGMANYLEVLTAQNSALNSQLKMVQSRVTQLNSMITLYRALGGGWK